MQIPQVAIEVLRVAAPTLLAGITGPFGGIAASLATAALNAWLGPADIKVSGLPVPPGVPQPATVGAATPEEIIHAVQDNANNPNFLLDLKKAEMDLLKYEKEMGFRFAELEVKDKQRAGDFQIQSGTSHSLMRWGMGIVTISMAFLFCIVAGSLLLIANVIRVPAETAQMAVGVFGVIGTIVGYIAGYGGQVLGFYFGSSKGSEDKNQQIATTVRDLGAALGDAAASRPVIPPIVVPPLPLPAPEPTPEPAPAPVQPAVPAPSGMVLQILPELMKPHRHFAEGVYWALGLNGISIEGAPAQGTPGEPVTVRMIWKRYGDLCSAAAKRFGVPVELIVATICAESKGDPSARREEPHVNDRSVGLMQTLVGTARGALGRPGLTADDLMDPTTSIAAGTAYIAQQRGNTHFDPPKVAAAYNAGSIRKDKGEANRWKMLCYPTGTGRHIETVVSYFNDSMRVSAEDGWGKAEGVPSFVSCIAAIRAKGG